MNKTIHRAEGRGYFDHGWLKTFHSFSFADYYDPDMMGFGALRVINDDTIAPGKGFGFHPHENMEIVTVVLSGELEHKDSMGHTSVIRPGEIQIMSAGTGVLHSEYNRSLSEPLELFQIWIYPKVADVPPRYDQKAFDPETWRNAFRTLVSPEQASNALWLNQDAFLSLADLEAGREAEYAVRRAENGTYLLVIGGSVDVAGEALGPRDAAGIWDADRFSLRAREDAKVLALEVPMR
jgi:redox-sensitive bicupin YhaK (pirin superfamily)